MDPAIGYELGRDYARHGLIPPPEQLRAGDPVRQGWEAGRQRSVRLTLVRRERHEAASATRPATPALSLFLQARLQAWLHGQTFELMSITPHIVGQLRVSHCPVTRAPLCWPGDRSASASEPVAQRRDAEPAWLCRLNPQAAYAAGNLAVMSLQGEAAHGLNPAEQARRAVLTSFVTALPHDEAARLPLLVLPPNRVRLLNPIQALQALLTLQLARSGWSKRLPLIENLLVTVGLTQPTVLGTIRSDLRSFFYTLMSRSIAAGRPGQRPADQQAWRWALEDAWAQPQVLLAWQRLARQINPAQAEALVQRAAEAGLCTQHVQVLSLEQATDGWALAPLAQHTPPTPHTR